MAKLTLSDIAAGYGAPATLNANNAAIETALENTLSRDGSDPNNMESDLDMDSNRIINLGSPVDSNDAARWIDVTDSVNLTGVAVPALAGNANKHLVTDGSSLSWAYPYIRTSAEISAGVTPSDYSYPPLNVLRYGADNSGASDSATAFTNAVRVAEAGHNEAVDIPEGDYKINSTVTIHGGVKLKGRGSQGTTAGGGTQILFNGAAVNCFTFDGNHATSNRGTGGGLMHLDIVVQNGVSARYGVEIIATNDTHRPTEFMLQDVTIYGAGTGTWARPLVVDGTACNTVGSKGVRDLGLFKVRVASARDNYKYIHINQGVHVHGAYIQVDTGNGTGTTGLTIEGDSSGVCWSGVEINGTIVIDGTASNVNIQGHASAVDQNYTSCVGSFVGSIATSINNASKLFRVSSNAADSFFGYKTATAANQTGNGTTAVVAYDAEAYDRNSSFDYATGLFTAKCAGTYHFEGGVLFTALAAGNTSGSIFINHRDSGASLVNDIERNANVGAMRTAGNQLCMNISAILELSEGDTVRVRVQVNAGGADTVGVGGAGATRYTYFMGKLLS